MVTNRRRIVLDLQVIQGSNVRAGDVGVPLVIRDLKNSHATPSQFADAETVTSLT